MATGRSDSSAPRLAASYEESRARFRQGIEQVRARWPGARLERHPVGGDEGLTIDWVRADALVERARLLILTSGEHGAEGYVGAAMLQMFVEEFLPRLSPRDTGLLLVHALNPWGMKHRRRTNAANVDLNRNFASRFDGVNVDYERLNDFLNPQGALRSWWGANLSFAAGVLRHLMFCGPVAIRRGTLAGQYRFPQGVYYGGETLQEETQVMTGLYRRALQEYEHVVLLDMHTGYGSRYQMSLVNSPLEPRSSAELARQFAYPRVVKADSDEFYPMSGDMIDFLYTLAREGFPTKRLYAASFEFGTLGDSLPALLRSLRTMILENQLYRFGASNEALRARVVRDFSEMFAPPEERWRVKAAADARRAFVGILRAEGFL